MEKQEPKKRLVSLDMENPIWDQVFNVAPLVLIGTQDEGGQYDLAPKHMVTPLSWENHFGFVCTPRHRTYRNATRTGAFTVSFPRPSQVVATSLAATARCDDDAKPVVKALLTFPARQVQGVFLQGAYLFLECAVERVVDDFGPNSLLAGKVVAAYVDERDLRRADRDDPDLIHDDPLLVYLHPRRFASVDRSYSFPFPRQFKR